MSLPATSGAPRPWATALLSLAAVATLASPSVTALLAYRRPELADGQWWRALGGHWTHWSADHLIWDLVVFAAVGALLEARGRRLRLVACSAAAALVISGGVWLLEPGIGEYRGLSGIATALFTLLALDLLRESLRAGRRGLAAVLVAVLVGSLAKLALEIAAGGTLFVDAASAGFVTVWLAHLLGAGVGAIFGVTSPGLAAEGPVLAPGPGLRAA